VADDSGSGCCSGSGWVAVRGVGWIASILIGDKVKIGAKLTVAVWQCGSVAMRLWMAPGSVSVAVAVRQVAVRQWQCGSVADTW
jgi:hypothetical protein